MMTSDTDPREPETLARLLIALDEGAISELFSNEIHVGLSIGFPAQTIVRVAGNHKITPDDLGNAAMVLTGLASEEEAGIVSTLEDLVKRNILNAQEGNIVLQKVLSTKKRFGSQIDRLAGIAARIQTVQDLGPLLEDMKASSFVLCAPSDVSQRFPVAKIVLVLRGDAQRTVQLFVIKEQLDDLIRRLQRVSDRLKEIDQRSQSAT